MTKEEIIDGLQFTVDMFLLDPNTGETYTEPRNDMDKTTIDACKGAIELLEQEPRWIPVSEKLPKSSGVYIVSRWFSDGEERAILVDANYYDGNGDWYNDNRINWDRDLVTDKIVAWMPLPEPYKPERSKND